MILMSFSPLFCIHSAYIIDCLPYFILSWNISISWDLVFLPLFNKLLSTLYRHLYICIPCIHHNISGAPRRLRVELCSLESNSTPSSRTLLPRVELCSLPHLIYSFLPILKRRFFLSNLRYQITPAWHCPFLSSPQVHLFSSPQVHLFSDLLLHPLLRCALASARRMKH